MNSISRIFYISLNTLIEAFKDRLVASLVFTGVLLIFGSHLVSSLSFVERRKIFLDVGFTTMFATGVLLAVFASTNLLVREVETKRIFCVFSKPIRRSHFILGKFLGILWTLLITILLLSLVLLLFVKLETGAWEFDIFDYSFLLFFELLLLSSMALFFSSFTTQFLGIFYTMLIIVAGQMIGDVKVYAESARMSSQVFAKMIVFFFPNLQVFNVQGAIVHNIPIDPSYLGLSAAYALSFILFLVIAAVAVFANRDFNK